MLIHLVSTPSRSLTRYSTLRSPRFFSWFRTRMAPQSCLGGCTVAGVGAIRQPLSCLRRRFRSQSIILLDVAIRTRWRKVIRFSGVSEADADCVKYLQVARRENGVETETATTSAICTQNGMVELCLINPLLLSPMSLNCQIHHKLWSPDANWNTTVEQGTGIAPFQSRRSLRMHRTIRAH